MGMFDEEHDADAEIECAVKEERLAILSANTIEIKIHHLVTYEGLTPYRAAIRITSETCIAIRELFGLEGAIRIIETALGVMRRQRGQ